MPGIPFRELADKFVSALEMAGATVLTLSPGTHRPLTLGVVVEEKTYQLEVYLWTITHGGKGRGRPREYRIQRTSADPFRLRAGVRTIMGGWHPETGTFAFWDVRRHLGVASSPSSQISLDTLEAAEVRGLATEYRRLQVGDEVAIAVQPDYLLWYVREYERIYGVAGEVDDAGSLVDFAPEDERVFIDSASDTSAASRRHQLVEVVRAFRDARFRPFVLRAYNFRCCLTGVSLRLVDAAHVVPVSDPRSTDETKNGIALNPLLHRAYDAGLLGLMPGRRTAINSRLLAKLKQEKLDAGLDILRNMVPRVMTDPTSPEFIPPDDYLRRGLLARGWTDQEIVAAS